MFMFGKIVAFIACAIALSSQANAATYTFSGKVNILRTHDYRYGSNQDWFSLDAFTSTTAPTCPGNLARIKDDLKGQRMFKALLLARTLQTTVTITLDDTVKDQSSYCFLQYLDI